MYSNSIQLSSALNDPAFGEHHHDVVDAPIDTVWHALTTTTWSDLHMLRALWRIRSPRGGPLLGSSFLSTLSSHAVTAEDPPHSTLFALVGKPWSPVPRFVPLTTLDEVPAYREPGWLKYGMEWRLTPLEGDRTLLETRTLCQPTDARARRVFACYWTLIRVGSGLIRRDMIATVGNAARRLTHERATS